MDMNHKEIGFQDLRVAVCGDTLFMELFSQNDDNSDSKLFDLGIDNIQRAFTYEECIKDLMHDERQLLRDLGIILKIFFYMTIGIFKISINEFSLT